MRLFPTPPYHDEQELLDSSGDLAQPELEGTLRDIRRANIFGLGTWVVKHHLEHLVASHPKGAPIRILDLATGSADIPQAICRWADSEGYDVSFVATDISEAIVRVARQRICRAGLSERVAFAVCDAVAPPFHNRSFDIVVCSLAMHHLSVKEARAALRNMARLARLGFVVNDIYRSKGAWYMARLLTLTGTANRLTRHDGPVSVLRAFTPAEMRRLGREAEIDLRVYRHPFWRMAAVGNTRGKS
jgi:2-polyprenyl-3-methyl-5-hydroxy-6-metoxy-1,4-benzoquinol methylase